MAQLPAGALQASGASRVMLQMQPEVLQASLLTLHTLLA
jgi:hypothetical protein